MRMLIPLGAILLAVAAARADPADDASGMPAAQQISTVMWRALQGEPDVATPTFVVADDRAIETRKPGDAALAGPVDRLTVANEIVVQTDDNTAAWAWVIATVDATPVKTPKARPAPYRAMVVYAKLDATWQLVTANFSVVTTKR